MRRVSMARQGWGTNAQNESATTFFLVRAVASPSLSPAPVCLFGVVNKRGAGSGPWEDHRSADKYAGWVVRGGGWGGLVAARPCYVFIIVVDEVQRVPIPVGGGKRRAGGGADACPRGRS